MQDNSELAALGFSVSENFLYVFLRSVYPRFPEEWIMTIVQYLKSPSELAFMAAHLGIKDIVLYSDQVDYSSNKIISAPPNLDVLTHALMALVGALAKDKMEKAHLFIRDFILARLPDIDLTELISIPNPLPLLQGILRSEGRGPPETRLIYQSSMNTVLACFEVGIYSDCQLIGEAPGETILIAEEEALRQSIRNFFKLTDNRPSIPLHGNLDFLDFQKFSEPNISLNYYLELAVDHV
ncbi:39S ribosomal protein L44, mitochondrial, variant 3 [Schistosoma haematobium]|nr:39S ribosomal protein L44, mitochondrial, variant 3 [Schistosoma haematobium]KAH9588186.1 39S ribosomal protein L44, mitochondrial, variant 3 [Schistosoma haematobium]